MGEPARTERGEVTDGGGADMEQSRTDDDGDDDGGNANNVGGSTERTKTAFRLLFQELVSL